MSVPPSVSTDSRDSNGSKSVHRPCCSESLRYSGSSDAARFGVVACILFMAGGLYWTASVGLLTLSALTAYPLMVMVGVVLSLLMFGAASWTTRNPVADSATDTAAPISLVGAVHTYDAVTGLPMYRLFLSLLKQALIRAQKEAGQAAILVIELEHFTPKTDAYARRNRNLMYRVQAARVKSALRTTDVVARLAEARFAVLLEDVTTSEEVLAIAKKMQATIAHPVTLDRHELLLSSRIGISLSSRDGADAQELIDAAVHALERTRVEGGSPSGTAVTAEASLPHPTSTLAA